MLAKKHNVTVFKDGKLNKGWAGHTVERYLGLPINSAQSPNLGTWELKVVPLVKAVDGSLSVKETVAITMLDPEEVKHKEFQDSHLYTKLRKQIVVGRIREDDCESKSIVHSCNCFELEKTTLYYLVELDYYDIKHSVIGEYISSKIGRFIQTRTKGKGHGSTSRAFYARKDFVEFLAGLKDIPVFDPKTGPAAAFTDNKHQFFPHPPTTPVQVSREVHYDHVERKARSDCSRHAGQLNMQNRRQYDTEISRLPYNQSGEGRHKCPYCAYEAGYYAGETDMTRELKSKMNGWLDSKPDQETPHRFRLSSN